MRYGDEKLQINSVQEHEKYCPETTFRIIKNELADLFECGWDKEERNGLREYYRDCLNNIEDKYNYIVAMRDYPSFTDYESAVCYGMVRKHYLNVVYDAFDEICKRLKQNHIDNKTRKNRVE